MRMVLVFLLSISLVSQAQADDDLSAADSKRFKTLVRKAQRAQHAGERLAKRDKTRPKAMKQYKQAASLYIEAFKIKEAASILFLLAEVYKTRDELAWAVRGYRRYLEVEPAGSYSEVCEERIAEIGDTVEMGDSDIDPTSVFGEAVAEPEEVVEEPEEPEPVEEVKTAVVTAPKVVRTKSSGKFLRYGGMGSAALGLVFVGLGVKFGLDASSASDELSAKEGAWTASDRTAISGGESDASKSLVFSLVGAASIIGGGVLYYLGHKRDRPDARTSSTLVPALGRDSVSLQWAGSF